MDKNVKHLLVVVDMQKDFIDGVLGTAEAVKIVPNVVDKIIAHKKAYGDGSVIATRDTHHENYLETQEGKNLPVIHCVEGTDGWQLNPMVAQALGDCTIINKLTFGSRELVEMLLSQCPAIEEITFIGLCTGICVSTNAQAIKTFFLDTVVNVDASCCACVSQDAHYTALKAMKLQQIHILNEGKEPWA